MRSQQTGFTLLETLVAIVILTVGLLGLAQLMLVALDKHEFAEYTSKAVEVAQAKIEELKAGYQWQVETGEILPALNAGSHGPETMTLLSVSGTTQGQRSFLVSWNIVDSTRGQKNLTVFVAPPVANRLRNKTVQITSFLGPQ